MPRKPRSKRPKAFGVGHAVRVKAIRPRAAAQEQDGRWYWQATITTGGTKTTVWSGWGTADEASAEVSAIVAKGEIPDRNAEPVVAPRTVREVLLAWYKAREAEGLIAPETLRNYKAACVKIRDLVGDVEALQVNADTVRDYCARRLRQGGASGSVALELQVWASGWRWGRERGHVRHDLPRVRWKVEPARNRHTPSDDDVEAVLGKLAGWPRLAVFLLWATGARVGEVAAVRWRDFDPRAGEITLHGNDGNRRGKTGARTVPLGPDVLEALRAWPAGHPDTWLLGVKPETVRGQLRSRYLPTACTAAKVKAFTPHGLRRAAVQALARSGVDVGAAADLLGHSPKVMWEHYRQVTGDDRRKAINAAKLGRLRKGRRKVIDFPGKG